jgi:hypothetical protein
MKNALSLALAALLLGAAVMPADAASRKEEMSVKDVEPPLGAPLYVGLGAQSMAGKGLMVGADMVAVLDDNLESGVRLYFYPQGFTKFFAGDVSFSLAPRLGRLLDLELPIEIQPMAGLEGGMYMDDFVAPTTGSSAGIGTANAYVGLPVGLRLMRSFGQFSVAVQGVYHYQLFDVLPTQYGYTTSRWHYEADARLGAVAGGVYYETGTIWSGPGLKVGLNF